MTCPNCKKEHCIWTKTLYGVDGSKQITFCKYCETGNENPSTYSSNVDVVYDTDGGKLVSSPAWRHDAENIQVYHNGDISRGKKVYI